jgi:hypothetical protein
VLVAVSVVGCDEESKPRRGSIDEDEFVVVDVDGAIVRV